MRGCSGLTGRLLFWWDEKERNDRKERFMNYCKKCGKKLKDGTVICPRCKANQEELEIRIKQYQDEVDAKNKKRRKRNKIIAAVCAAVVVIAVVIAIIVANRPEAIDITDYLVVEYYGEDGEATAEFSFDYDAFYEDYGDEVTFIDESDFTEMIELLGIDSSEYAAQYLFETYVSGSLSPDEGLSVGDYVSFIWEVDEDGIDEIFGIEVTYEDQILVVDELQEAEEDDEDEDEDADSDEDSDTDEDEDTDSEEDTDSDEDTDSEEDEE